MKKTSLKSENPPAVEENSTAKGEDQSASEKTEDKSVANKTVNRTETKIDTAKKSNQPVQNGKQIVRKKPLSEQSGKNITKKPVSTERKSLQRQTVSSTAKSSSQKKTCVEGGKLPPKMEKQLVNKEKLQQSCSKGATKKVLTDAVDARLASSLKNPFIKKAIKPIRSRVPADSEVYNMNHKRRGVAIILNHMTFTEMTKRGGTEKDALDLADTLDKLHFEVRIYNDPTLKKIFTILETTAAEDHTDADCLVVVAMSHGESGQLHSYETQYPVDMLWTSFVGEQCPTLVGKPKLFFIQACRGTQLDKPMQIIHQVDSVGAYTIPTHADIMVAFSTYDGFYSWRNPNTGSWFIQALCQELNKNWRTHDLLRIMTSVVRRVAIEYQSFVPHDQRMHGKKQVPSIVSMLTRLVYFSEKSVQKHCRESLSSVHGYVNGRSKLSNSNLPRLMHTTGSNYTRNALTS